MRRASTESAPTARPTGMAAVSSRTPPPRKTLMAAAPMPEASTRMYQGKRGGLAVMSRTSASPCAADLRPRVTSSSVSSSRPRACRSIALSRVCSSTVCMAAPCP